MFISIVPWYPFIFFLLLKISETTFLFPTANEIGSSIPIIGPKIFSGSETYGFVLMMWTIEWIFISIGDSNFKVFFKENVEIKTVHLL